MENPACCVIALVFTIVFIRIFPNWTACFLLKVKSFVFLQGERFSWWSKYHNTWFVLATFIILSREILPITCRWAKSVKGSKRTTPTKPFFTESKYSLDDLGGRNSFYTRKSRVLASCWLVSSQTNRKSLPYSAYFPFFLAVVTSVNWPYISQIRNISKNRCGCSLDFYFLNANLKLFSFILYQKYYTITTDDSVGERLSTMLLTLTDQWIWVDEWNT